MKDFFYYTKSERRAIYVCFILIALFVSVLLFLPEHGRAVFSGEGKEDSVALRQFLSEIQEKKPKKHVRNRTQKHVQIAPFDPNLADSIELLHLGLPEYVVRNVLKYRAKGGIFRTAESFSRIYGLKPEVFEQLKPFIRIQKETSEVKKGSSVSTSPKASVKPQNASVFKYPEGTRVDVGRADTTELKKIPGIGSGIARRIVVYRERLGGFYDLSQLQELERITPEMMKWFKLESGEIRKIAVNRVGLERLRSHPYLNFHQAKVIVEHRKKRGEIKSLSQLALYEEFTEKDLIRLSYYLDFN